jgi:hypothetical protein
VKPEPDTLATVPAAPPGEGADLAFEPCPAPPDALPVALLVGPLAAAPEEEDEEEEDEEEGDEAHPAARPATAKAVAAATATRVLLPTGRCHPRRRMKIPRLPWLMMPLRISKKLRGGHRTAARGLGARAATSQ